MLTAIKKVLKHLVAIDPCETIVNVGLCAFLVYLTQFTNPPGFLMRNEKLYCSKLFRFGEAGFRSFGVYRHTFCHQREVWLDECASLVWETVLLTLYPRGSMGAKVSEASWITRSFLDLIQKKPEQRALDLARRSVVFSLSRGIIPIKEKIGGILRNRMRNVQTSGPGEEQEDAGGEQDTSVQTTTRRRHNTRTFKGVDLS
jgi:hypothetical protein